MSFLSDKEIACPYCKHPNQAEAWTIINAQEDPELRDLMIGGELNLTKCDSCSKTFLVEHFLMYHDPSRELFAFVYPAEEESNREALEAKALVDFETLKKGDGKAKPLTYDPLVLFGLSTLVELISQDEDREIQGDIAEALLKENKWPYKKLSPHFARENGLPTILPFTQTKPSPVGPFLVDGVKRLLDLNDQLSAYQKMLSTLEANPGLADVWAGQSR